MLAYSSVTRVVVESCLAQNSPVELRAEDFLEPDRFDEIRTCVDRMSDIGPTPGTFTFVTVGFDGVVREIDDLALLISAPTLLPDGTVVVVDGGKELLELGSCENLVDFGLRSGSRLVVWPAGRRGG